MADIETIVSNGLCSGCGLCAGLDTGTKPAVAMRDTPEGYRRPELVGTPSAAHTDLIGAACPGLNIKHDRENLESEYHPTWGPLIATRLGWSNDAELRQNASSGGGLSAILSHLLDSGEVDYVVQTAVSPDSPIRNALTISEDKAGVFHSAGSRYAPSSPLEDISKRLNAPGKFAFVGKPCDVAGLRQLARTDKRVAEKVPYMLAFMCAGVPSYRGTSHLLRELGVEDEGDVTAFRFRGDGWPGFATAQLKDGRKFRMDYDTSWGNILNRHLQFRCKICPDGIGEFADIVCADGWHCDDQGNPLFDEQEGRSLIITRSKAGEALIRRAEQAGTLSTEDLPVAAIEKMQPFQAKRKGLVLPRLAAMAVIGRKRPDFQGLELIGASKRLGLIESLRSMLGTLRRLIAGQGKH